MNQRTNLAILAMVLSIPFALSQTRKAIPAGRYEVLSGVKTSYGHKNIDVISGKDSMTLFWAEVAKNIPQEKSSNLFFSSFSEFDPTIKSFFYARGASEVKNFDDRVNIFLSDNLNRDLDVIKKLKNKGSLVVLRDKQNIKEVLSYCSTCEVILFQADSDQNYYLLRTK